MAMFSENYVMLTHPHLAWTDWITRNIYWVYSYFVFSSIVNKCVRYSVIPNQFIRFLRKPEVTHNANKNWGFTRLSITKKHYWLTQYIFRQIMPSSEDTNDSLNNPQWFSVVRLSQSVVFFLFFFCDT
jgi:hypothetical protein